MPEAEARLKITNRSKMASDRFQSKRAACPLVLLHGDRKPQAALAVHVSECDEGFARAHRTREDFDERNTSRSPHCVKPLPLVWPHFARKQVCFWWRSNIAGCRTRSLAARSAISGDFTLSTTPEQRGQSDERCRWRLTLAPTSLSKMNSAAMAPARQGARNG